jgi:tRNA threonylcarbamoyladenosine biosynthesis protein TsaB
MRLLAVESATVEVGAAIVEDGEVRAQVTTRPGRRHVETLHPAIEAACTLSGTALTQVDAIAVDVGPGLFTGLRVGIAAAKALAFALGVPLVSATSLDILHHAASGHLGPVAAVVDMRRGELAYSLRMPGASSAEPISLSSLEQLVAALGALRGPLLLVGDGARRYDKQIRELVSQAGGPPLTIAGPPLGAPPVASLALLAAERLSREAAGDPYTAEPVYLRPVDARINWSSRDAVAPCEPLEEVG